MKKAKLWYSSKTVLVNGLLIVSGLATQVLPVLPPESRAAVYTGMAVSAINVVLRKLTGQPVKFFA